MRRHRPGTTLLIAAALLFAADASAQWGMEDRRASRVDVGVYAGGTLTSGWYRSRTIVLNGTDAPTRNDDAETFSPGYAPAFGAIGTLWMTPALGIRLHGAYVPMRPPTSGSLFANAGDRRSYTMNGYLYDLGVALRPFATSSTASRSLSSVYLFAGGGGFTVNLAGTDRRECEPSILAQGGCLSFQPSQATVGQGSAGAGIGLIPLGRTLSLFGEAGVHLYDSPVHVGDEWVGTIRAPTGSTVRIADDRFAVTGRLALGVRAMLGNLLPPPPVVAPPPPPVVAPPPPAQPTMRAINVCVVSAQGQLQNVQAQYNPATGDTMVAGQQFRMAHPAGAQYAAGSTWYIANEGIMVMNRRYVKFGLPRVLGVNEVTRVGDHMGVPVFAEAGRTGTPEVLYIPVRPGCEFQPYQTEIKTGGVRGD